MQGGHQVPLLRQQGAGPLFYWGCFLLIPTALSNPHSSGTVRALTFAAVGCGGECDGNPTSILFSPCLPPGTAVTAVSGDRILANSLLSFVAWPGSYL